MKAREITKTIFILVIITLFTASVTAESGSFISQNPMNPSEYVQASSLYFTGTSSDPGNLYLDAYGANEDIGIQLCDVGQRYVGGFYAMNIGGAWESSLVTYSSSSEALAYTSEDTESGCYGTVPGFVTISPSHLTTSDPDVYKAALPGNLWIGYDTGANPGTVSDFVFSGGDAKLRGDYNVQRSFDQSTRQIAAQTPQIQFRTSSTSFSKPASDSSFGISSSRQMVMGVCDDDYGQFCSDGQLFSSPTFPATFDTGLGESQVNDQQIHTKYVVMNGIGKEMCIGANLKSQISSVTPDPVYYSQNLEIQFAINNPRDTPYETYGGNVDVTTPFDVRLRIYEAADPSNVVYTDTFTVSSSVLSEGSLPYIINWPAFEHSGIYTVEIDADIGGDITECNEGDNIATMNFELLPITLPEINIDGLELDSFPVPNVPYNVTFHMENSDGDVLRNANVIMTEKNGLNLAAPTQTFEADIDDMGNTENRGVVSTSQAYFMTDYYGNVSFTFIPTYNKLYFDGSGVNLSEYVGNYSLSFTGNQSDGENFKFVLNGSLESDYPLTIDNKNYTGPYNQKELPNKNMVSQVLDYAYHAYTNFIETLVG
ncbi:MAG: hypothetical protein ACQESE_00280 [Nanobdellota archaeon]